MKKAQEKNSENKPDVDKAKKVYRLVIDAVKRLDEVFKKRKAYREVFLQDAVGLRNKLKEYCERLMFYNPMEYGRKAEDVLWRQVFYQTIQLIKQNRKHVRQGSSLEAAFRTHLSAAMGYYNHLLFRLQYEFALNLHGVLDFHLVPEHKAGHKRGPGSSGRRKENVSPVIQEWATKACHRCLMCLGDIARYQQDFDKGFSKATSERFYQQAIVLSPDNGMPHNQLGTLSGARYYHCEAAYHYIRCMVCEKPFEGAESNLQRLFEKNRNRLQELKQCSYSSKTLSEPQSFHDLRLFLIQFLQLIEIFFDENQSNAPVLQERCQSTLHLFNRCMYHAPDHTDFHGNDSFHCLDDDMVFKLVVMCMAVIHILYTRGSKHVTAATAFLLALFSHILNHCVMRVQGAMEDKENPNKLMHNNIDLEEEEEEEEEDDLKKFKEEQKTPNQTSASQTDKTNENMINQDNTKTGTKSSKRRRRRRGSYSSDSSDLSDVSDLSEGGADLSDGFLSDDSDEEEEFVGFFANDSDSDMSDTPLVVDDVESMENSSSTKTAPPKENANSIDTVTKDANNSHGLDTNVNNSLDWTSPFEIEKLAYLSSELFSQSSMPFLKNNLRSTKLYDSELTDYEDCRDVMQGKKNVSVPPGFASSKEADYVAEITKKLANFVIETDTEASLVPTDDSEHSGGDVDGEADPEDTPNNLTQRSELEQRHSQNALDLFYREGLICVVKVMCDWMRGNTSVIMTCAQSSQSLWHRLSVLCNLMPTESWMADHDQCWMQELKAILTSNSQRDWGQVFPLREDVNLWLFTPLSEAHATLKLSTRRRGHLSEMQECFLRLGCIRQFGHFLSGLDNLHFSYDSTQKLFIGPSQPVDSTENEQEAMQRVADEDSRRNQLMKDMAQLRLKVEVSQLEGSIDSKEVDTFPPYLIPDTSCLCECLPLVKTLAQTGKGILIIPTAVIDSLDYTKKESVKARDAIRWLETEFRKGNRYMRSQKPKEKMQDVIPRTLKKRNRQLWCLWEVLSCARYLAQQGEDISDGNIVAVLTGKELDTTCLPAGLDKKMFEQEGITIESIGTFKNKWKDQVKSKG